MNAVATGDGTATAHRAELALPGYAVERYQVGYAQHLRDALPNQCGARPKVLRHAGQRDCPLPEPLD